jgi:hypothetical protein
MSDSSSPSNIRPAASPQHRPGADLHVCAHCRSELVQPVDGAEPVPGLWDLTLRCPECERFIEVRTDAAAVERYEHELDRGLAVLQREMDDFARLSFEEDVERFVAALEADAIMPMDFGPAR